MSVAEAGHNIDQIINGSELRAFIERIECLEEEKAEIGEDIGEVYKEAKGKGLDTKTIRKVIAIRKLDRDRRRMEQEMLDTYLAALGIE
jgi:uncharacterized protein (UPF0335 family)